MVGQYGAHCVRGYRCSILGFAVRLSASIIPFLLTASHGFSLLSLRCANLPRKSRRHPR